MHVLVLFKILWITLYLHYHPMHKQREKINEFVDMLHHVLDHHIVIIGDLKTFPKLKYRTDIFAMDPIPHQTIYHLEK